MRNGIHTLRGQITIPMTAPIRSAMFNGSWTRNFKIKDVQIFPAAIANNDTILILHMDDVLKTAASAADNQQIGWASTDALAQDWSYVDPDHVLVQDIFISAIAAAPGTVNYVIKLERVTTSESEAILDLVKANAQNV